MLRIYIKFQVKSNSKTVNLTATIDYFVNPCGGVINGEVVTITSPNYPESYQQNTRCAWLVELPDTESIIVRPRNDSIAFTFNITLPILSRRYLMIFVYCAYTF